MNNGSHAQTSENELPGDVQWTIGTVADLEIEAKALLEDAQRLHDGYVMQVAQQVCNHSLALRRLLQTLQAHVGLPTPRLPVWEQPTTILRTLSDSVPIDTDD